jgi:hypothetical protein
MKFTDERPIDRQTEEVERTCDAEAEETITVPAGTFSTIRVVCRNTRNDAWNSTFWYASKAKHVIRMMEESVLGGRRVRELLTYRAR